MHFYEFSGENLAREDDLRRWRCGGDGGEIQNWIFNLFGVCNEIFVVVVVLMLLGVLDLSRSLSLGSLFKFWVWISNERLKTKNQIRLENAILSSFM
jgi:hypothetical protein